jgi:DNA-directed RNA polymerase specialized sigma24 family protein
MRGVAERLVFEDARRRQSRMQRERAVARKEAIEATQAGLGDPECFVLRRLDASPDPCREIVVGEPSAVLGHLEGLREPYREVVRLRCLDELATAEIAERLGRGEATVRSQLKRGLDLLRARLGAPAGGERTLERRLRRRDTWGTTGGPA